MDYHEFLGFCRGLDEPWLQVAVKLHQALLRLPARLPGEVVARMVYDLVTQARRHVDGVSVLTGPGAQVLVAGGPGVSEHADLIRAAMQLRDEAWRVMNR